MLISQSKVKFLWILFFLVSALYSNNQQTSNGECSPNLNGINGNASIDCSKHQTVYQLKDSSSFSSESKRKLKLEKIKYFTKQSKDSLFIKGLYGKVKNQSYELISIKDNACINIEAQKDFDNNGGIDVLLSHNACGGNGFGNVFSIMLNYGNGHFEEKTMEPSSWEGAIVEKWEDRWSIRIKNTPQGVGFTDMETNEYQFIVDNSGNIKELVNAKKSKIFSEIEVYSSELDQNLNYDKYDKKKIVYDLDGDGKNDVIKFKYWERWGSMFSTVIFSNGSISKLNIGCQRVGILESKTKNVNDLVCNHSTILRWDGEAYVDSETN